MNAGPTSSRIYELLRTRIRDRGLPPGTRLDPAALADELGASPTPVRDALHILSGEDIVIAGAGGGFTIPMIDQPSLYDLYGWNYDVLAAALRRQRPPSSIKSEPMDTPISGDDPVGNRIGALFLRIADQSLNIEHARAQARINERLHTARIVELSVISDSDNEFRKIENLYRASDAINTRKAILSYTRKRQKEAGNIINRLYRGDSI